MEDLLTMALLGSLLLLIALDFLAPGRRLPRIRFWRLKGAAFVVLVLGLNIMLPLVWGEWLGEHRLIDATGLGIAGGAVVAFVVAQVVSYFWHRAMHRSDFLWRWFHQMHHSAERLDIWSGFYFHPFDVAGFAFVSSFAMVMLVGVVPEAAAIAGTLIAAIAWLGHANLRTPRWLGFIVQRPENHALHHARGVHAHNYADVSFVDMIFGTFRNADGFPQATGFHDGASSRVGEMLIGRDVSQPQEASGTGLRQPA